MKGGYALVLHLPESRYLKVGKLGGFRFASGYYLYFGSALNSLEGRIQRHLRADKKRHWHIDFLTAAARSVEVWWTVSQDRQECRWTNLALGQPGVTAPAPGFGSSDCRTCPSHLVYAGCWKEVVEVREQLELDPFNVGFHLYHGLRDSDIRFSN